MTDEMITLGDCDGDPSSKADGTVHSPLSQAAGQQRIPVPPSVPHPPLSPTHAQT